jgi:hypothetical protein
MTDPTTARDALAEVVASQMRDVRDVDPDRMADAIRATVTAAGWLPPEQVEAKVAAALRAQEVALGAAAMVSLLSWRDVQRVASEHRAAVRRDLTAAEGGEA